MLISPFFFNETTRKYEVTYMISTCGSHYISMDSGALDITAIFLYF